MIVYDDGAVALHRGDAREIVPGLPAPSTVVLDPPFEDDSLWTWAAETFGPEIPVRLIFTDPRSLGDVVGLFGPCSWVFTWDTGAPWNLGPRRPLTQTRFALLYADLDGYDRDGALYGDPPAAKNHPSTRSTPLDGRRLVDLHKASLRWLHHPGAGARPGESQGERFARKGHPAYRHAKPLDWVRCLIGNTARPGGYVLDPFAGSATTLVAARALGLPAVGVELDPVIAAEAGNRLGGPGEATDDSQLSLFGATA